MYNYLKPNTNFLIVIECLEKIEEILITLRKLTFYSKVPNNYNLSRIYLKFV